MEQESRPAAGQEFEKVTEGLADEIEELVNELKKILEPKRPDTDLAQKVSLLLYEKIQTIPVDDVVADEEQLLETVALKEKAARLSHKIWEYICRKQYDKSCELVQDLENVLHEG